jgi:hypothetical protein
VPQRLQHKRSPFRYRGSWLLFAARPNRQPRWLRREVLNTKRRIRDFRRPQRGWAWRGRSPQRGGQVLPQVALSARMASAYTRFIGTGDSITALICFGVDVLSAPVGRIGDDPVRGEDCWRKRTMIRITTPITTNPPKPQDQPLIL